MSRANPDRAARLRARWRKAQAGKGPKVNNAPNPGSIAAVKGTGVPLATTGNIGRIVRGAKRAQGGGG